MAKEEKQAKIVAKAKAAQEAIAKKELAKAEKLKAKHEAQEAKRIAKEEQIAKDKAALENPTGAEELDEKIKALPFLKRLKLGAYVALMGTGVGSFMYLGIGQTNSRAIAFIVNELNIDFKNKEFAFDYVNDSENYGVVQRNKDVFKVSGAKSTNLTVAQQDKLSHLYDEFANILRNQNAELVYISEDAHTKPTGSFGIDSYWRNVNRLSDVVTDLRTYFLGMRVVGGKVIEVPFTTERQAISSVGEGTTSLIYNSVAYNTVADVIDAVVADLGVTIDTSNRFAFNNRNYTYSDGQTAPITTPTATYAAEADALIAGIDAVEVIERQKIQLAQNYDPIRDWESGILNEVPSTNEFAPNFEAYKQANKTPEMEITGAVWHDTASRGAEDADKGSGFDSTIWSARSQTMGNYYMAGVANRGDITGRAPWWLIGIHHNRIGIGRSVKHANDNFTEAGWASGQLANSWPILEPIFRECIPCNGETVVKGPRNDGINCAGYGTNAAPHYYTTTNFNSSTGTTQASWYGGLIEFLAFFSLWEMPWGIGYDNFAGIETVYESTNVQSEAWTLGDKNRTNVVRDLKCKEDIHGNWKADTQLLDRMLSGEATAAEIGGKHSFLNRLEEGGQNVNKRDILPEILPNLNDYRASTDYTASYTAWLREPAQIDNVEWNGKIYLRDADPRLAADILARGQANVTAALIDVRNMFFIKGFANVPVHGIGEDRFFTTRALAEAELDTAIDNWNPWVDGTSYQVRANNPYGLTAGGNYSYTQLRDLIYATTRWGETKISDANLLLLDPNVTWRNVTAFKTEQRFLLDNFNNSGNTYIFNQIDTFLAQGILSQGIEGLNWSTEQIPDTNQTYYFIKGEKITGRNPDGSLKTDQTYFETIQEAIEHWRKVVLDAQAGK